MKAKIYNTILIIAVLGIIFCLVMMFSGCQTEAVEPVQINELNAVWNSRDIPNYDTKYILLHLTSVNGRVSGSGQFVDNNKIRLEVVEGPSTYTHPNITITVNIRYPELPYMVDSQIMGRFENGIIKAHWSSPFWDRSYPLHLVKNNDIQYLPKLHDQGGN